MFSVAPVSSRANSPTPQHQRSLRVLDLVFRLNQQLLHCCSSGHVVSVLVCSFAEQICFYQTVLIVFRMLETLLELLPLFI